MNYTSVPTYELTLTATRCREDEANETRARNRELIAVAGALFKFSQKEVVPIFG